MEFDLIRKAAAGDAQALNMLVDKHKELAYTIALRIVKNPEDAKDITQDSFLKALEKLYQFREESKFSTWLFRIVYNESMMFIRKQKKQLIASGEEIMERASEEEDEEIDYTKRQNQLNAAIEKLDPKERMIIDLFYLGDKSIKEIHAITGLSTANVKVVLHRSREKLKKNVKDD